LSGGPQETSRKGDIERHWNENSAWVEHVNEEQGKYYYFNETSGTSQWEPPTLESQGGYCPCVWRIQFDVASGRYYFHHRTTGEVAWNVTGNGGEHQGGSFTQANPMV